MYNNYQSYMREVLGYPYNRVENYENGYAQMQRNNTINIEVDKYYPEIYKIIKPMIINTCEMYETQTITEEILEEMTMKIYISIETNENIPPENQKPLKNGDVINPNAKREINENRNKDNNYLLKDLIKILLINELKQNNLKNYPIMPPRPPQGPTQYYQPFINDRPNNQPSVPIHQQQNRPPMRPF